MDHSLHRFMGLIFEADINNDGFTDIIISTNMGHTKFFEYRYPRRTGLPRYIPFLMIGDGEEVNQYGIGATLILYMKTQNGKKWRQQVREVSSYQVRFIVQHFHFFFVLSPN